MKFVQVRIILLATILVLVGLVYYDWHRALHTHQYSPKLAVLGPLAITMALYVLILPTRLGTPTSANERKAVLAVFAVGTLAGLVNLYFRDPGLFGR